MNDDEDTMQSIARILYAIFHKEDKLQQHIPLKKKNKCKLYAFLFILQTKQTKRLEAAFSFHVYLIHTECDTVYALLNECKNSFSFCLKR